MSRVINFDIQSTDLNKTINFYTALFNWKFNKLEGSEPEYYVITTGDSTEPGINGGLLKRTGPKPIDDASTNSFVCTIQVDKIDNYIKKVIELQGNIVVPKYAIGNLGFLCYAKDTDGNIFGIMEAINKSH